VSQAEPAIAVRAVSKRFGATQALANVSLEVGRGTIHALLGGNGSGKSTLIRILAGVTAADSGEVVTAGRAYSAARFSAGLSRECNIHVVHQHSSTFPHLTVAENLCLGHGFQTTRSGHIRWAAVTERATEVLERFGIAAKPDQLLSSLRPAAQMMVAIARALQAQEADASGILILDEPTAALSVAEVELLSAALRRYARAGQTVILVTHRLEEVLELADHATVLRDGEVAGSLARAELTHDQLVALITPRTLVARQVDRRAPGAALLEVAGVAGGPVRQADVALRSGEIVGLAGLVGSGRSGLLRLLFGLERRSGGTVRLGGRDFSPRRPLDAMRLGVAYVPEDRIADAAFAELSVCHNVSIANLRRFWSGWRLRAGPESEEARRLASAMALRPQRIDLPIAKLSGDPSLLLLDEPTQGVDVGARAEIHALIREAVADGAAALVVSSDFAELAQLCDRVAVVRRGRTAEWLEAPDIVADRLHELAYVREPT
jgi:ribose transport system ATP-binding protein